MATTGTLVVEITKNTQAKWSEIFVGAIFAAFCSFIFFLLQKEYEQIVDYHNVFVSLETELNYLGTNIWDKRYLLENAKKMSEVRYHPLMELKLDIEHVNKIRNIKLKNRMFSLLIEINKYNVDESTVFTTYNKNVNLLLQNKNIEQFGLLQSKNLEQIEILLKHLTYLQNEIIYLLSYSRVLMKQNRYLRYYNLIKIDDESIENEKKKLEKEIEESLKKSSEDIKKIFS